MDVITRQGIVNKAASFPTNSAVESGTFDRQLLRILRCTANAFAIGPGGCWALEGTQRWRKLLARTNQAPGLPVRQGLDGSQSACTERLKMCLTPKEGVFINSSEVRFCCANEAKLKRSL